MPRLFTKREKTIFYITICVVIFSTGFNFLIIPILKKNDTLNKEINIARGKFKKYTWLLSQKEYLENKYNKFSTHLSGTSIEEDAFVGALSGLENIAKDANIRIIDIRPQVSKSSTPLKEATIDLKTEGTMEGYLKFIYNIENSPLLLKIRRFQLNPKPNSQTLEGNLTISHFLLLLEK